MTPEDLKAMAVTYFANLPADRINTDVIRQTVAAFSSAGGSIDPAMLEAITRELEVKFEITMDDAAFIKLNYEPWMETRRASVESYYWNRYRRLLGNSLPPRVLGTIDKDTDRIVGLLENPEKEGPWRRRGLVVGHVQSGKTANYIGVISKAADYGYKFVVLLAGLHNSLRHQTQERVEEGFIGLDSALTAVGKGNAENAITGVGRIDSSKRPVSVTSKSRDFHMATANGMNVSFSAIHEPMILVIKKQTRILENLTDWLRANNQSSGGVIRGVPMLLVDDEADNASVNTAAGSDPTQINKLIRLLLGQFEQNCYLGYTATPFANIFIDPDTDGEMLQEDLFPRDFIVSLEPPDNYVGPQRVFLEDGDLQHVVREVDDFESVLPLRHKIAQRVDELPESLRKAVRCFVLCRAIRLLRGAANQHNSMLVNVSRFNAVQQQVTGLITDYLTQLRNAVQNFGALGTEEALVDSSIRSLRATWDAEFGNCEFNWQVAQGVLNEAVSPIAVRTINNRSPDNLEYRSHKTGLNVIAVGGLSLSRGLTLEGLTVSYFLRNSIMYDTLLQMGRWFGYRDGYADLCRIFMPAEAVSWYGHITEAIDELRAEFRVMEQQNRRPEDFGLKVRAHPDSLIVTARNKMRTGKKIRHSVSLAGKLIETTGLSISALEHNAHVFDTLIQRLDERYEAEAIREGVLWRSASLDDIRLFIAAYRNHDGYAPSCQTIPLLQFLNSCSMEVERWDVCLYNVVSTSASHQFSTRSVGLQYRAAKQVGADAILISGKARRVASRGAERAGLSDQQVARAKAAYLEATRSAANVSDRYYRHERSRPLMMLHMLNAEVDGSGSRVAPAWGISFPVDLPDRARVEYVVNTTWYREHFETESIDEDEDDVEE